jgi:hypothetical protein
MLILYRFQKLTPAPPPSQSRFPSQPSHTPPRQPTKFYFA